MSQEHGGVEFWRRKATDAIKDVSELAQRLAAAERQIPPRHPRGSAHLTAEVMLAQAHRETDRLQAALDSTAGRLRYLESLRDVVFEGLGVDSIEEVAMAITELRKPPSRRRRA